jgi:hypothetical protein
MPLYIIFVYIVASKTEMETKRKMSQNWFSLENVELAFASPVCVCAACWN